MKNIITSILAGLLMFCLFYLIGAFIEVSFDISKWSIDSRIMVGAIEGVFSFIVMFSVGLYKIIDI